MNIQIPQAMLGMQQKDPKEIARKILQHPPLIAASCSDGIVIAALTQPNAPYRVRKIVGHLGYGAIGFYRHIREVAEPVCASAIAAFHHSSPDDVWVQQLAEDAQTHMHTRNENILTASPSKASIVFVGLGAEQEHDELAFVDIESKIHLGLRFVVIPDILAPYEKSATSGSERSRLSTALSWRAQDTMDEALAKCFSLEAAWREQIAKLKRNAEKEPLVWEVGRFSRQKLLEAAKDPDGRFVRNIFRHEIVERERGKESAL